MEEQKHDDDEERWETSNMEYGKFYRIFVEKEKRKEQKVEEDIHAECRKKLDEVNQQLRDIREQINLLRLQQPTAQSPATADVPTSSPRNKFESVQKGKYRRGKFDGEEAVQREKCDDEEQCSSREPRERWDLKPDSKGNYIKEEKQSTSPVKQYIAKVTPTKRKMKAHADKRIEKERLARIDPETAKYNFYKYYGFAGQGAKTSWGHNLPLGQDVPHALRAPIDYDPDKYPPVTKKSNDSSPRQ